MATAEQIRSLIRAHISQNSEQFYSVALQIAAYQAQIGHVALATDIRDTVEKAKIRNSHLKVLNIYNEGASLFLSLDSSTKKEFMVLEDVLMSRLNKIIEEYAKQDKIKRYGLTNRRKILLMGPPGTGKTMTAYALANSLKLRLNIIQMDKLLSKFMGETSAKLRQIFDFVRRAKGVYLFDEFDAIGGDRSKENDIGEMRRVLNSFLQFIEQDDSESIIIATTNNPKILDKALYRRFDDVLTYSNPGATARVKLIRNLLAGFIAEKISDRNIYEMSVGLSHADIDMACKDAIKEAILNDKTKIEINLLRKVFKERKNSLG